MSVQVSILILAAGASSRMRGIKQLLPWGKTTMLKHIISVANSSKVQNVYVVTGAHQQSIHKVIKNTKTKIIHNPDWSDGMGKSIAVGIRGILESESPDGILVILCDQPLIDSTYINKLIDIFQNGHARIIGTEYPTKIGVPALFGAEYFAELQDLNGNKGAGKIIAGHRHVCVSVDPKGKHKDIDTDLDYRNLLDDLN